MLTDVKSAAKELDCSVTHARRMIKSGGWPPYRLGPGVIRVDPAEVLVATRITIGLSRDQHEFAEERKIK
jgi:hypothetical protein